MEFEDFDENYLERLKSRDPGTQEHFVSYFSLLAQLKFGKRFRSITEVEDACQDTFTRFFTQLQKDNIREPKSLGAYFNGICNMILKERIFPPKREEISPDEDVGANLPDPGISAIDFIINQETAVIVREVLDELPKKDRRVLRALVFEDRDRDEVCAEFGITRKNLRVILPRAIKSFKDKYLKRMRQRPPGPQ